MKGKTPGWRDAAVHAKENQDGNSPLNSPQKKRKTDGENVRADVDQVYLRNRLDFLVEKGHRPATLTPNPVERDSSLDGIEIDLKI